MAFCANCGKEISDQAVQCPNCGHPGPGVARPAGSMTPAAAGSYAEWWQRAVAWLIDAVVISVPSFIIMSIAGAGFAASAKLDPETGQLQSAGFFAGFLISWLILMVIGIAYKVILEGGPKGQTLGKMAMKIQVRDANTQGPLGYGKAAVRWLVAAVLWIVFYIPGIIDLLFPLWDPKKQTIHDKAAGSIVTVAAS